MEVGMSNRARKFIRKTEAKNVVIRFVEVEIADSLGAAKDIEVTLQAPDRKEGFRHAHVDGVDVYVDKALKVTGPVVIKKQGFWKFSTLYADGLQVPL